MVNKYSFKMSEPKFYVTIFLVAETLKVIK